MAGKIFGTDGVRGKANAFPLTPAVLMRIATAVGQYFTAGNHRHTVIIGKDTRLSGYMIEPALVSGFISAGMDAITVGPLPTPAVAMLTRTMRADLGVMISASHNPFEDNGLKFFGPDGRKLSDDIEAQIEHTVSLGCIDNLAPSAALGRAVRLEDARGRYIEYVKMTLPRTTRFEGLKIVVDCAHGAGYRVAPRVLWELGAEVISIGVSPDGTNINAGCGATDTRLLRQAVLDHGADIGIALDGDADRVALVDEQGQNIDGDQILGLLAKHWQAANTLRGDGVVGTVMSNLGLELFLQDLRLKLYRASVGDRYVTQDMGRHHCNLGGEQSGHVILSDFSTTGDGLVSALQVLKILVEEGRSVSQVCRVFKPVPQILKNVRIGVQDPCQSQAVQDAISDAQDALSGQGRLLVRKSGTEPLLRIMAEGHDEGQLHKVIDRIVDAIQAQGPCLAEGA